MTVDEFKNAFREYADQWLSFDDQPHKPHSRPDIAAMITLDRLDPGHTDMVVSASHDEIWFDAEIETVAKNATSRDVKLLAACKVRIDGDSFAMFV